MMLIAHRGLHQGPNAYLENCPSHIQDTLNLGLEVEIDLHVKDDQLYLGHDYPQYPISEDFLHTPRLWIHAKNIPACNYLTHMQGRGPRLNYFWHEGDSRVLTSWGYWWTQPGCGLADWSIAVMPETQVHVDKLVDWGNNQPCVGICSDYVGLFK